MAAHSKAPWFAVVYPMHWVIQDANDYEGRDLLATDDDSERAIGEEKAEANARLMAAAPDLLAACEALPLDEFDDEPDAADFKDNAAAFMRAMDLARAAIDKAKRRA